MKHLLSVLGLLLLVACSEPTYDSDNPEESLAEMASRLDEQQNADFLEAYTYYLFTNNDLSGFDGKTAGEIIVLADTLRVEEEVQAQMETNEQEINQLLAYKKRAAAQVRAREMLANFMLSDISYLIASDEDGSKHWGDLSITLTNNTDATVSRIYASAEVKSEGREVPWAKGYFNYDIPGGMQPGESQRLNLMINEFTDLFSMQTPDDAVFVPTLYKLDGADGNPLAEANPLSDLERQRLEELSGKYPDL